MEKKIIKWVEINGYNFRVSFPEKYSHQTYGMTFRSSEPRLFRYEQEAREDSDLIHVRKWDSDGFSESDIHFSEFADVERAEYVDVDFFAVPPEGTKVYHKIC